jgi:hypothetical protein
VEHEIGCERQTVIPKPNQLHTLRAKRTASTQEEIVRMDGVDGLEPRTQVAR